MDTKLKNVMRIALIMLYSIFPMGLFASDPDSTITTTCTHSGIAYAPYDDDCYFYIILDNGLYLKPKLSSIPEVLYPSGPFRVTVGYEVIDSISNSCGTGFLVSLTCIEMVTDTIRCFAYFTYEKIRCDSIGDSIRCGEYAYQFLNYSSGNVTAWDWDFGDGTGSSDPYPIHEFPGPGVYDVCLTISTSDSCSIQYCETIDVGTTSECMAMFEYYSADLCDDTINKCIGSTSVQFIDYSYGNITNWSWDFGDSTTSEEQNPVHEFPAQGEYMVCLNISSPDECNDTYCTLVNVGQSPECHAYFEYCIYSSLLKNDSIPSDTISPDTIPSGDSYTVGFRNLSEGEADYFFWDFGDGSFSPEENPVHSYNSSGIYNVCLYISSYSGCYDTYCTTVNVGSVECNIDFTYEIVYPDCIGYEPGYMFSPILDGSFWSIYWDFGDGNYSFDENAANIYEWSGVYSVCVEVYYENNCYATLCKSVEVTETEQDSAWYDKCSPNGIPTPVGNEFSVREAYPNPASDQLNLTVNSPFDMNVRIELVNFVGQTQSLSNSYTLNTGENQLELDLSNIETGTYIYLIYSESGVLHGRIYIVR